MDALVSVDEVRDLIDDSDAATASIQAAIFVATGLVQGVTGRLVQAVDQPFSVLGHLDRWLDLPGVNVTAVDDLTFDGEDQVADEDYRLIAGRLFRECGWQAARYMPSVIAGTFSYGYANNDPRLDTAKSIVMMVAAQIASNPSFATSETIADYSVAHAVGQSVLGDSDGHVQTALRNAYGRSGATAIRQAGDLM